MPGQPGRDGLATDMWPTAVVNRRSKVAGLSDEAIDGSKLRRASSSCSCGCFFYQRGIQVVPDRAISRAESEVNADVGGVGFANATFYRLVPQHPARWRTETNVTVPLLGVFRQLDEGRPIEHDTRADGDDWILHDYTLHSPALACICHLATKVDCHVADPHCEPVRGR